MTPSQRSSLELFVCAGNKPGEFEQAAVRAALAEITRLRELVVEKDEALRELADSSKYMLFGVDCPGGAHVGWMAYGRPDKIAKAALEKE